MGRKIKYIERKFCFSTLDDFLIIEKNGRRFNKLLLFLKFTISVRVAIASTRPGRLKA